jgi:N-methylhydantoinase A
MPKLPLEGTDPSAAKKAERPVYWPELKDFRPTPIFTQESLRPGNVIPGPAVIEGEYTTIVVPPSMRFSIDERSLGILES